MDQLIIPGLLESGNIMISNDIKKAKEIIENCISEYYDVVWLNAVDDIVENLIKNNFKIINTNSDSGKAQLYTTSDLKQAFEAGQKNNNDSNGFFHWLSSYWPDYTKENDNA